MEEYSYHAVDFSDSFVAKAYKSSEAVSFFLGTTPMEQCLGGLTAWNF